MTKLYHDEKLIQELLDAQPDSVTWFQPVFERSGDATSPVIDFEVGYCNNRAAQVLDSSPAQVSGTRLLRSSLMDSVSLQRIFQQCFQVWNTGQAIEFTYHSPGKDRYFNVQRSKVSDGILSITRDRTHEMKVELSRQEQEQRYRQILDIAADGILLFEAIRNEEGDVTDFRVAHANRRAYEIGALPEDTVGKNLLSLLPHLRGSQQFDWHRQVVESGEPFRFETTFRTPEGNEYGWFIVSLTRLGDGVVSNFVDVTQRKRNEQKIEEQKQFLQRIFDSSVNGMMVCTAIRNEEGRIDDLRIGMINGAFTQILGYTEEESVGKTYIDIFPASRTNGVFAFNASVVDSGVAVRKEIYYKGEHLDAWFDVSTSPFAPDGLLVTFTEITARKRLQLELEHKVEELKRSNQSLEEFAYAASHDLQEPLRKIHFFSDRLKQALDPGSEHASMFARMESATTRMRDLIEDLLSFSRLSVVPEVFTEVDLNKLIQEVMHELETAAQESGARIRLSPLPVIRADERQIRQLFQNLLGNALKYHATDRVPEVDMSFRICTDEEITLFQLPPDTSYFLIEVRDNGIGFEQQYAEKIFQVFQRLHGRREYAGSGVGLAIARKVAANHSGYIKAEGSANEGAVFTVILPVSLLVS
jgi:signal transduction histidine kinase/sarcosine oxidase delta subunit